MIQRTAVANSEMRLDRAEAQVQSSENQSFNARLHERARAHRARFYRRIKRGFSQTIVADFHRVAQNQKLGVRRRVAIGARPISRARQKIARFINQTRADRNFVPLSGFQSRPHRLAHPELVDLQRHRTIVACGAGEFEMISFSNYKVKKGKVNVLSRFIRLIEQIVLAALSSVPAVEMIEAA
jgi:hypothetical protein